MIFAPHRSLLLLVLLASCADPAIENVLGARDGDDDGGEGEGDAGEGEGDAGEGEVPARPCDPNAPVPPLPGDGVLWAAPLSASGDALLSGHGHDDGRGPVGFCPGTRVPGQPFYELVAVGFEPDLDMDGDGDQIGLTPGFHNRGQLVGESGGRVHVYVDILDEDGVPLNEFSAPELRIERTIVDGPTELFPLTSKPANEFQTNFNMQGGGARYGVQIAGASDRVINVRLPNNHHVCYVLVFRRTSG